LQIAQVESRQKPAGWGWVPRYKQQGTPGQNLSVRDVTVHRVEMSQSIPQ